jgi:beta-galactosidase
VIQLPHDFVITGTFSPNGTDGGQAYLPKNVSWYRKHFSVPASWANQHVDVVIEGEPDSAALFPFIQAVILQYGYKHAGAFSVSYWWLNGVYLGVHDMGYTNAIFRLDNASLLVGGGDNVLAVYVDATLMGKYHISVPSALHSILLMIT